MLVIGLCLLLIYLLNLCQYNISKDDEDTGKTKKNNAGLFILSVLISFLIIWINGCLVIFINFSTN